MGQIGGLRSRLRILQNPDNLLFSEPRSLQSLSFLLGQSEIARGGKSGGHVNIWQIASAKSFDGRREIDTLRAFKGYSQWL